MAEKKKKFGSFRKKKSMAEEGAFLRPLIPQLQLDCISYLEKRGTSAIVALLPLCPRRTWLGILLRCRRGVARGHFRAHSPIHSHAHIHALTHTHTLTHTDASPPHGYSTFSTRSLPCAVAVAFVAFLRAEGGHAEQSLTSWQP